MVHFDARLDTWAHVRSPGCGSRVVLYEVERTPAHPSPDSRHVRGPRLGPRATARMSRTTNNDPQDPHLTCIIVSVHATRGSITHIFLRTIRRSPRWSRGSRWPTRAARTHLPFPIEPHTGTLRNSLKSSITIATLVHNGQRVLGGGSSCRCFTAARSVPAL
jgi:hypothetical protein